MPHSGKRKPWGKVLSLVVFFVAVVVCGRVVFRDSFPYLSRQNDDRQAAPADANPLSIILDGYTIAIPFPEGFTPIPMPVVDSAVQFAGQGLLAVVSTTSFEVEKIDFPGYVDIVKEYGLELFSSDGSDLAVEFSSDEEIIVSFTELDGTRTYRAVMYCQPLAVDLRISAMDSNNQIHVEVMDVLKNWIDSIRTANPVLARAKEEDHRNYFIYEGERFLIPNPPHFQVPPIPPPHEDPLIYYSLAPDMIGSYATSWSHRAILEASGISDRKMSDLEISQLSSMIHHQLPSTFEIPISMKSTDLHPGLPEADFQTGAVLTRVPYNDPLAKGLLFYRGEFSLTVDDQAPVTQEIDCCVGFIFINGRAFFLRAIDGSESDDIQNFATKIVAWRNAILEANAK